MGSYLVEVRIERGPGRPVQRVLAAGVEGPQGGGGLVVAFQRLRQQIHRVVHQGHVVLQRQRFVYLFIYLFGFNSTLFKKIYQEHKNVTQKYNQQS